MGFRAGHTSALLTLLAAFAVVARCALPENGLVEDASTDAPEDTSSDLAIEDAQLDSGSETSVDAPLEAAPLSPDQLPSRLEFWVRSDELVTDDAGDIVEQWPDKSGHADPNRNALPTLSLEPTVLYDAGYGWPVVNFAGNEWLQTGQWANGPFSQPLTVFIVGDGTHYFMDSLDPNVQCAVVGITGDLRMYAGAYLFDGGVPVSKRAIVAVFDGLNSTLHNNQNNPTSVGNPGSNGLKGITLGQYAGRGAGYSLAGSLAEVAIWSRALAGSEIAGLNAYASVRYGIVIAP